MATLTHRVATVGKIAGILGITLLVYVVCATAIIGLMLLASKVL